MMFCSLFYLASCSHKNGTASKTTIVESPDLTSENIMNKKVEDSKNNSNPPIVQTENKEETTHLDSSTEIPEIKSPEEVVQNTPSPTEDPKLSDDNLNKEPKTEEETLEGTHDVIGKEFPKSLYFKEENNS